MTCSGFSSYGLVNHVSYKSKQLHWMRSKFIGSNRTCLKWGKVIFVILSHFLKYYPLQSHFEFDRIFLSKNLDQDHTPHWGQMRDILKTLIELMDKKKGKIGSPTMKKNKGVKGIQENFEKGYVKNKKKNEMKGECLSILRKARKVSIEERHIKCQKSTPKNQASCLLVCLW